VAGFVCCVRNGKQTISKVPDLSRVEGSPAQGEHRQRFGRGVAYAWAAMAEAGVRAVYEQEAGQPGKRPFDLAVSDYFRGRNLLVEESRKKE